MRSIIYQLSAVAILGICLSACESASAPKIITQANRLPATGKPMPPVSANGQALNLQDLGWELESGAKQKLSDLKGKVIVLDFWATYCPPCLEEIPHLIELKNKHAEQGLVVVGLHVGGEEDLPNVPAFVKKLKIEYDLGTPQEELTSFLLTGTYIPQTFIIGRDGKLAAKFTGYDPEIKKGMDKAIEQALAAN